MRASLDGCAFVAVGSICGTDLRADLREYLLAAGVPPRRLLPASVPHCVERVRSAKGRWLAQPDVELVAVAH